MRALITGINGFVGGHLAERLIDEGDWEVWGLARQEALALPELQGRVRAVAADLSDYAGVLAALG